MVTFSMGILFTSSCSFLRSASEHNCVRSTLQVRTIQLLGVKRIETNKKTCYIRDFVFSLISSNHFKLCIQFCATFHVSKVRGASVLLNSSFFKDVNRLLLFYTSLRKVRKKVSNPRRNVIVTVTGYNESAAIFQHHNIEPVPVSGRAGHLPVPRASPRASTRADPKAGLHRRPI